MGRTGKDYRQSSDPLFGLAILKLTGEIKGRKAEGYDAVLQMSMAELGVTSAELKNYIKRNRALLEQTIREEGLIERQ
ncbi:MAG: hypothetical protein P9M14_14265 [Candidatus Alcyoniella australis]|nr:hypothetical protein [Candidatus Alcyoniella australis]